jgi:haloalkane dehalogenase
MAVRALRAHADGTLEQVLGNPAQTVTHLMLSLQTIARPQIMTASSVQAYSAHFTDRAACKGAIRFPQQLVSPDPVPAAVPDPSAPIVELPNAGHFRAEDSPEASLALLQLFLAMH